MYLRVQTGKVAPFRHVPRLNRRDAEARFARLRRSTECVLLRTDSSRHFCPPMKAAHLRLIAVLALVFSPVLARGQIAIFEDGTTEGWQSGSGSATQPPLPPTNIPTSGPAGADDNYLLVQSVGGSGPGSRFSVLNESEWALDYVSTGITHIRMDVNNLGVSDVSLRLLFEDLNELGVPVNLALSADAVFVPVGSGWTSVLFDIRPAALLAGSIGSVDDALAGADVLRIFHNPDPAFPGPPIGPPAISAKVGFDNMVAIPEPATFAFIFGLGAIAVLLWHRRSRT